ncbi:hypothetical protein SSX86_006474 [Deinandra increscens subsp. villosa]|uniref:Uncharacterized protein n=1 Tax=Deinandra increscens subsp. villosa TaxID=3103831 RepID=A0AAP0GJ27_9ASTR
MKEAAKNGLRSGLVVIGAVAFGYLSLQLGFKPYLEKAEQYNSDSGNDTDPNPQSDHHDQVSAIDVILDDDSPS